MGRRSALASTIVLGLVTGAGCTSRGVANREPYLGSESASSVNGVQEITLRVDKTFRFTPSAFSVHPGRVRVVLHHTSTGSPHTWQLIGFPGDYVPMVSDGQTASVTFDAPAPGSYTFICTIHERQGQTGTMTVLPK